MHVTNIDVKMRIPMSDGEGGFAKVWLCSLGGHPPLPRLGGVLGMTDGSNMVVVCWTA